MREIPTPDDRISEDRYGCSSVLFSNVEGYDTDEIVEAFSEFAEVLGVRRAGDDWGIHFVTFGSYEDAKSAVDGLQDHPDIRLKVFHKNKPQHHRRRYDGDGHDDERRAAPRRWNDGDGRAEDRRGQKHANDWAGDRATQATEDASEDNDETRRRRATRAENGEPRRTSDDGLVEQPTAAPVGGAVAEGVEAADDVESISSRQSAPGTLVELASEVIVGNVDSRIDEAFLLHLFNKYEPIAVSQLVPVGPRADVRVCSVYFKNDEVARRVERMCDKLCLVGRQIVVQRPSRLIATYLLQI